MNSQKSSSILISCCIAFVLLLSLWGSFGQHLYAQQQLDNGEIVLNFDEDSHANDSFEQIGLISRTLSAIFVAHDSSYPSELVLHVLPGCYLPPDRPPESV
jgi:hypothetical protein